MLRTCKLLNVLLIGALPTLAQGDPRTSRGFALNSTALADCGPFNHDNSSGPHQSASHLYSIQRSTMEGSQMLWLFHRQRSTVLGRDHLQGPLRRKARRSCDTAKLSLLLHVAEYNRGVVVQRHLVVSETFILFSLILRVVILRKDKHDIGRIGIGCFDLGRFNRRAV